MLLWTSLAIVYIVCLIVLGLTTLRKGHFVLFFVGIIFPILWIIGAVIRPTQRVAAGA
jgi:hypothetical protein